MAAMDPNPKSFPIVSYVMSRLQSLKSGTVGAVSADDVELGTSRPSKPSSHELQLVIDRLPELQHPELLASMAAAISDVAQARSVLQSLGDRPDHETVDVARARIGEIDDDLARRLDEIVRETAPETVDRLVWRAEQTERERACRESAENERAAMRAVIELDDMHESYEKLLKEAEERLERMYNGSRGEIEGEEERVEEEMDEEVVRILREGMEKGVERVEIAGRQLRILPEAFGRLRGLLVLNVSKNRLQTVPDAISGLEYLEELYLSSNNLTSLPDSLGLLSNLKILDVSSNKLKSLPDSISKCRFLVELDASYNELSYLPTNIGFELLNLEKLCIQLNKIRSLPSSICEMRSLRLLDAHFNELRGLPHAIGKLTNLEVLNISSNFSDLQELPATFGDLINLREVDLSNNQIHSLPDSFGRLDKLTKLNLEQNPLIVPPVEIVNDGVEAVKEYMMKRWLDLLLEEERKSTVEEPLPAQAGWLTRSTSWLNNWVSGVSGSVSTMMETRSKSFKDPYLEREL